MKAGPITRGLARLAALATIVPAIALAAAPAHAESAPGCAGTTQIGTTVHVTIGGETFASVKQFKGCGKNWAYVYVWSGYRASHSHWEACASIAKMSGSHGTLVDLRCNYDNPTQVWSTGANTLADCTQAVGWYPDVADAHTSTRC